MSEIEELTALARKLLEQDAADIEQAWQQRGYNAERLAVASGTTVLTSGWRAHRELVARQALLDEALGWEHCECADPWDSCPQAPGFDTSNDLMRGKPCQCGRDARVLAVLRYLTAPTRHLLNPIDPAQRPD